MGKLTAAFVRKAAKGRHLDDAGLYLVVDDGGRRYWQYRYQRAGRERGMSLGSADDVSLADARKAHAAARALLLAGQDPLEERDRAKLDLTRRFADVAAAYIEQHAPGWHGRTAEYWRQNMAAHVNPVLGKKPVTEVGTADVLKVLKPLWAVKPETGAKVRTRVEAVLDFATAMHWRTGPNPAVWRGGLKPLLPATAKVHTTRHHPALDWQQAPEFMEKLRQQTSLGGWALAFLILTAVRSGEARGAVWSEFDLGNRVWVIPPGRMKMRREHRVPLSQPAMDILTLLAEVRTQSPFVFFGEGKGDRPVCDRTLKHLLRRMGYGHVTVHGFRSTFRDWCADGGRPWEVAEAALAHRPASKVTRAYARSDLLEQRRPLMEAWGNYLTRPPSAVVVPFPSVAA
jgi:integrase